MVSVTAPLAADDPSESETGVWAPPGRYSIELEVGGKHYRESLTVAPDPRIRLPADAYARQFALAREIEDARVQTAAALAEAGRTRSAIAERGKNAGAAAAAALAAADRQLLAISDLATEQPSPDAIGRAPGTIHGLRYLEAAFHNLARAVDDSDTAPTRDAVQGYARHRALLDAALASWARFKTLDLPRLNARLQSDGAAPIAP
ncbi:MAG: hypothetical protein ACRETS_05435 [Steroidobacteraceae bacterium]